MNTTPRRLHLVGFGLLLMAAGACTQPVGDDGSPDLTDLVLERRAMDPGEESECNYDAEAWAEITREDIACTKNSDCCYFVEACEALYVIVHADDFAEAHEVAPCFESQAGGCAGCIIPNVEPVCLEGKCVGQLIEFDPDDWQEGASHCGSDELVLEVTLPQQDFSCS